MVQKVIHHIKPHGPTGLLTGALVLLLVSLSLVLVTIQELVAAMVNVG